MEGRLLIKNCSVFRFDGSVRSGMALLIEQGKITKLAPDDELPILPGDWEVACRGRLVAPGLVDCHAHLVGGQLIPTAGELLLKTWRERSEAQERIESELTAGEVEALTGFALARALRFGLTTVLEHLRCPGDVGGGLEAQAKTAERLGMRFVASHATNSRSGRAALSQLEANAERVLARKGHPRVRCALGFHASFDCDDELLSRLGRLRAETGAGVHGHVAESEEDQSSTVEVFGQRIVPRLEAHGLLGRDCVAAHANAIDRAEAERLANSGTVVALSPLRRWIDGATGGGLELFAGQNGLIALGSGGSISLWDQALPLFAALVEDARLGRVADPDRLFAEVLLGAPAELCARIFGERFGVIEPGCQADLVVYDLLPWAERRQGPAPDLLLRIARSPVAWTIIAGQVVVREGRLLAHDYVELDRDAQRALRAIWTRTGAGFSALPAAGR